MDIAVSDTAAVSTQADYRTAAAVDPSAKQMLIKRIHQIGGKDKILQFHTHKNAGKLQQS